MKSLIRVTDWVEPQTEFVPGLSIYTSDTISCYFLRQKSNQKCLVAGLRNEMSLPLAGPENVGDLFAGLRASSIFSRICCASGIFHC
jgi:hypothetical protein